MGYSTSGSSVSEMEQSAPDLPGVHDEHVSSPCQSASQMQSPVVRRHVPWLLHGVTAPPGHSPVQSLPQ